MKDDQRILSKSQACLVFLFVLLLVIYFSSTSELVNNTVYYISGNHPVVPFDDSDETKRDQNNDDFSALNLLNGSHEVAAQDEEDSSYDPAPRTTDIPYNEIDPEKRYFLYSPSGGLSNQLIEMTYALEICRLLNRTLYVPMIGRHSSGWHSYAALPYSDLFPTDRILDFSRILEKVPAVPLNMSVENFASHYTHVRGVNRVRVVFHEYRENWGRAELMAKLGKEKRKLVFLRGAEMYHPWFTAETTLKTRKHIRFSYALRKRAIDIVHAMFPGGRFNAMHVRLADYSERWGTFQERSRSILAKPLTERFGPNKERMNRSVPIYLASDEPNNGGFAELKRQFKVVTAAQLPIDLVDSYRNLFPKSRIRYDMMGVLEQLICAQAIHFSGTSWSTFSEHITVIRESKAKLFPELVAKDP